MPMWLIRILRAILLGAAEFGFAIVQLLALLIALILALLAWLWMLLRAMVRRPTLYPEEADDSCGRLPEAIVRRPDPAIYSQRLLMAQGLPVTWNNPDIWVAPAANPAAVEPDSYHLADNTDYLVTVRAHNAGTDPAIGVRVRLRYRPWSFNSPDEIPVEVDAGGNEVVHFVNIAPLGSAQATFKWHTPPVAMGSTPAHYCLQASLYHPMDTNPANNMGQENTNVYHSPNPGPPGPGETFEIQVPLHNFSQRTRRFVFAANTYAIEPTDDVELRLQTTLGYPRRSPIQWAADLVPQFELGRQQALPARHSEREMKLTHRRVERPLAFRGGRRVVAAKNRYVGFDRLRETILSRDYSLPSGMDVTADGEVLREGQEVEAREDQVVTFAVRVPPDAQPGQHIPLNLIATTDDGVLAGGVTVLINVREA